MNDYWLAGVIEGEGTIYLKKGAKYGEMSLSMSDEDVVRTVREVAGCGKVYGPYRRVNKRTNTEWLPMWKWSVNHSTDLLLLLDRLIPLFHSRRKARGIEVRDALRAVQAEKAYPTGVTKNHNGFQARLNSEKLGTYKTVEDAHAVYMKARRKWLDTRGY
jgi:hypothetical protein